MAKPLNSDLALRARFSLLEIKKYRMEKNGENGKYRSTFKEKFRFMLTSLLYERYCRNNAGYSIRRKVYLV